MAEADAAFEAVEKAQATTPRRILFAGDSLTEQLYEEARCVLGAHVHSDSSESGVVSPTLLLPSVPRATPAVRCRGVAVT